MGIFGTIMDKIFHHGSAQAATPEAAPAAAPAAAAPSAPPPSAAPAGSQPLSQIDVNATLIRLAAQKGGGGNWRTSIVDLLKLLDMDSSLAARKQLAQELDVHAGADGTAEQNIALSKAVMQKLAENGGQMPESLRG
jgi:hypothetical protein